MTKYEIEEEENVKEVKDKPKAATVTIDYDRPILQIDPIVRWSPYDQTFNADDYVVRYRPYDNWIVTD